MMDFTLDPPSGYADSYLDVRFIVRFEKSTETEVRLFNETSGAQLEILSVSGGYIVEENIAVVRNADSIEGRINLFNKDKMNKNLRNYTSVDIKCSVVRKIDGQSHSEEQTISFYNQSKSIDSNIIPFDINLINQQIDIVSNVPMHMQIVCDKEKRYELCVMSEDRRNKCVFEIYTKNGRMKVSIPSEILWSDLELKKSSRKKFSIYWVKFEGIDYSKFMNRRYIPIDGTTLSFNSKEMKPLPQSRNGPTGKNLTSDFVLSDRYFVHTYKTFSGFGDYSESFGKKKLDYLTRFMHEAQSMHKVSESVKTMQLEQHDMSVEVERALQEQSMADKIHRHKQIKAFPVQKQKEFFKQFQYAYTKKHVQGQPQRNLQSVSERPVATQNKKGCGCARKKHG